MSLPSRHVSRNLIDVIDIVSTGDGMSTFKPTDEQQAIIDAYLTGRDLVIEAGAGTGKTATLRLLAQAAPTKTGALFAYNKSIATDAANSFPSNFRCRTSHGWAFGITGKHYKQRLDGAYANADQAARILGINDAIKVSDITLSPAQLARMVHSTLKKFSYADSPTVRRTHVPWLSGADLAGQKELAAYLAPIAQRAWDTDIQDRRGRLRFEHDFYLKMAILMNAPIPFDALCLDEAQDANGALAGLIKRQRCQKILVGDRAQAINEWRGAIDAMANFDGHRLYLSQSFRFGGAVATEANKWLRFIDTPLRLRGFDQIPSRLVDGMTDPDAILCRTNAGAMSQVILAVEEGRKVALVGGGKDIKATADAAAKLMAGQRTDHRELREFTSWAQVQEHAGREEGDSDLKKLVQLVDRYGPGKLTQVCDSLVGERYAQVVISTVHKAKGREWANVAIGPDFTTPKADADGRITVAPEDAKLAYVAVTRARQTLDRAGLAWIDDLAATTPAPAPAAAPPAPAEREVIAIPAPAPVTGRLRPCGNPACPGDHISPEVVGDCSRPGWYDLTADGQRLSGDCRRCNHSIRACTCKVMPDRGYGDKPLTTIAA